MQKLARDIQEIKPIVLLNNDGYGCQRKCKSDCGFDDHCERRQTEVERPGTEEDNNHISGIKYWQKVN
jgi:hypothetical protein